MNDFDPGHAGQIVWLDSPLLNRDPRIARPMSEATKVRPFLLLSVRHDSAVFIELTSKDGRFGDRYAIPRQHVRGHPPSWEPVSFINDARSTYRGPVGVFREIARATRHTTRRPWWVTRTGVDEILAWIQERDPEAVALAA